MKNIYNQLKLNHTLINGKSLLDYKFKDLDEDDYKEIFSYINDIEKTDSTNINSVIIDENEHDTNFESWIYKKILNHQFNDITKNDIKSLVWNYEVKKIEGDSGRWTKSVQSICEICNVLVAVDWEEGLTEMQENEFYDPPYFVKPIERVVTITDYKKCDEPIFINENPKEENNIETDIEEDEELEF